LKRQFISTNKKYVFNYPHFGKGGKLKGLVLQTFGISFVGIEHK
jgi:hypothetical protein